MVHRMKIDFREAIFKSSRSVFRLRDIGMLTDVKDADNLKAAVNYYAARGAIRNIRKGIYVKDGYSVEELACRVYTPSYISMETVLVRAGVIFQYASAVTAVSYLSRSISVDGNGFTTNCGGFSRHTEPFATKQGSISDSFLCLIMNAAAETLKSRCRADRIPISMN